MFDGIDQKFDFQLTSFATTGHRFNDTYSLYKQSQQEGFQGFADGIAKGIRHGYIELPTGVGKTALFIALIQNYLRAVNGDENAPRVLIAVPTEKLAVQTAKAFAKFMPEIAKLIETDGDEGQEIDWEKSDIGLQYGKKKHAHKKPKVLITTYQSLSRDKQNKIYYPEEYGFVVYDEGHVITAPTFGKAVEKFKESIQLAVTATPEYSEIKAVSDLLPHCYYKLSLAEAMNRNDLCNVRPAIIKTGYKIDEELFNELVTQQAGKPLNDNQLEHLLNQEARNQSVIQTYLRGSDPDSGERYFGQNGMVFCTGVKHADMITEQFQKEMQEGDCAPLGEWLDREGIELIAPVHGKIKGAWLKSGLLEKVDPETRQYQDGKEWYTEEEIFGLHDQGKILLLASVAKLKWGYDCARDSVLFDLADRFSKLDATQIDGRVFRLDPEDDDKTATVFNLQDENSEEHYERHPELSPIHCAEVIEGAEFREPAKRRKAHIRFKEPPPEMEQTLQEAGFDVIHDINIVRTISGANQERRNKAKKKLPTKEAEWLSSAEMTKFYAGHYSIYRPMLEKHAETLRQNFVRQGKSPEEAADLVDKQFIGWRTNTGNSVICASPEAIAQLERQGTLRLRNKSKEADWLSNVEMKEYYIGSEKGFKSLLENRAKNLCQEFIQQGMSPEDAADLVDRNFIGLRLNGPNTAICASPEALMQLKQQGKLRLKIERPPAKEPGWLTGREMAEVYIGTSTSFNSLLERYSKIFCQEFIEQGNSPENAANLVEKQFAGLRTTGGQAVQCVSPEAIAQLVQRGELRLRSAQHGFKEQGWLSDSEMKKYYVGRREGFKLLLEKQAESLRQELIWQGQSPEESAAYVDKHFVGLRQIGGRSVLCASPAVLAQLEQQGKLRRRELIQAARPKKIKKPSSKSSPSGAGE